MESESPQVVLYKQQIQKLVSQVQTFIEAMKNLQKLIGSKTVDAQGNVIPPDKVQLKICKDKFEVSQKSMEQTIKRIKKSHQQGESGLNDAMAAAQLAEEKHKQALKEKEKTNLHKKQIAELEV